MAPELVTAADILEFDFDGERRSTRAAARRTWSASSTARSTAPGPTSTPSCTATRASLIPFADSDVPLRAMYHMAAFVAEGVPVFDIRKAAGMTDLLVRDAGWESAGEALGQKSAALMRHHGAVVVATSIPNVVGRSIYLDVNARVQLQT